MDDTREWFIEIVTIVAIFFLGVLFGENTNKMFNNNKEHIITRIVTDRKSNCFYFLNEGNIYISDICGKYNINDRIGVMKNVK